MTAALAAPLALRRETAAACELASTACSEVERARSVLFVEFIRGMNSEGIPYCLLSGYERYPLAADSDIDFMVRPEDRARILPLLQEVASRCGALLVQAIQHETSACYYVLAKQVGNKVVYLHPDCTTDYRRNGRLWLRASEVIRNHRRLGPFFLPAVADEFQYYLLKKVLKQQITEAEFQRLATLYVSHPEECCERLRRFWAKKTSAAIVSALVTHHCHWILLHLGDLLTELRQSAPQETRRLRVVQFFGEWRRRIRRVCHPTGFSVCVCGGNGAQRSELAAQLERNLRPAFRRTKVLEEEPHRLRVAASLAISKMKSTLIVGNSPAKAQRWNTSNQIGFDLSLGSRVTVETATRLVLEAISKRLEGQQLGTSKELPNSQF